MISVLVVDDSVVVRRLITDALTGDPDIRVVATAPNGRIALAKLATLAPDLVTLDIEMPVMDGLSTLRALRKTHPRLPVIMFSTLTSAGATATLDALAAGASDYVTKPANVGSVVESLQSVRDQLIPRIHALCGRRLVTPRAVRSVAPVVQSRRGRVEVIAIGSSTGGPEALAHLIGGLSGHLRVPVVMVQHMPPVFTRMLADRLNQTSALTVVEAKPDMPLLPGTVYLAPGDRHLEVVRRADAVVTRLTEAPPENSCRPAVDVLFRSVAAVYGPSALALVMTGMGQDGRLGAERLHAVGAEIVAQDEASSVVWGMPGAVVGAGLAHAVLPLTDLARHLETRVGDGRAARPPVVMR